MIRASYFTDAYKPEPAEWSGDWPEFAACMAQLAAEPFSPARKNLRLMVSPAVYAEGTRGNVNVQGWGGWFALDLDSGEVGFDDVEAAFTGRGLSYVIATTATSGPAKIKMRAAAPLSRDVTAGEAREVWRAIAHEFAEFEIDGQCKDPSRAYFTPAAWIGSNPRFAASTTGVALDVDAILERAPPPPEPPAYTPPAATGRHRARELAFGLPILDSPVVTSAMIDDYLALRPGEHHVGLFRFCTRVAARALAKRITITAAHLTDYARQVDAMSLHRRDAARWRTFNKEAEAALAWASQRNR